MVLCANDVWLWIVRQFVEKEMKTSEPWKESDHNVLCTDWFSVFSLFRVTWYWDHVLGSFLSIWTGQEHNVTIFIGVHQLTNLKKIDVLKFDNVPETTVYRRMFVRPSCKWLWFCFVFVVKWHDWGSRGKWMPKYWLQCRADKGRPECNIQRPLWSRKKATGTSLKAINSSSFTVEYPSDFMSFCQREKLWHNEWHTRKFDLEDCAVTRLLFKIVGSRGVVAAQ